MTEQMLRQYTVLVEYLGATLGPDYEVVLHEILPETSRVAAIANGSISGRSVGAVQFTVKKLSCSQASIYRYIKKAKAGEKAQNG